MTLKVFFKFLFVFLLFSLLTQGKCKKSSGDNPDNWTRDFRLRLTFSSYVRHMNGDIRCGTIQEQYCANSLSDLMGCRSCHWAIPGLLNVNLYSINIEPTKWFGTIELYDATNNKSLGIVNLSNPNGRISCGFDGYFYGKIPANKDLKIIVKALEPCFGTGFCRGGLNNKYPRTLWYFEVFVPAGTEQFNKDDYLDEGKNGQIETGGLC